MGSVVDLVVPLLLNIALSVGSAERSLGYEKLRLQAAMQVLEIESQTQVRKLSPFDHCETSIVPPTEKTIPEYQIDLDLPPEERWNSVIRDKKVEIIALIENIKRNCDALFGRSVFWMVDKFVPYLTRTLPTEYIAELNGISKETGISLGEVTLFNLFYEFFSVCTSIVAQSENGILYHGRNLDFGLFLGWNPTNHTWITTDLLRPLVVHLSFNRNNKTIYQSVNYAGYLGVLTAMKQNEFTLSIDERFRINGGYVGLAEWIIGMRNLKWIGFLARETMEKCESYSCAQKMLMLEPLVAPVYFILTGNKAGQGCIITRGRKNYRLWYLGQKQLNQSGDWFMVQTNYDQWKSPPFYDDRRSPAIECMDQLGRSDLLQTLANVLSTRPVLNKLTTYMALMSAKENFLKVRLQFCSDPCWPW